MSTVRGSIWRKCDFHIHTPFSSLSNNFGDDFDKYVQILFKKAIEKNISIIGITDYFTIEGYKKIKNEYINNDIKLNELFSGQEIKKIKDILLLPNIEFRLNKVVQINKIYSNGKTKSEAGRINFHVIFSDKIAIKDIEENFLHDLDFVFESDPDQPEKRKKLKVNNLQALGNKLKREQAELKGSDLQVGMIHAVIDDGKILEHLANNSNFKDNFLVVVPSDEDLSQISFTGQDGQTRKVILSKANAFFSSNQNTILFGLGEKSTSKKDFLTEFKSFKPCIWGSDAHDYEKMFEPDKQRYCFIKAGPSFEGLRQILYEPQDRVFIGVEPPLFTRIKAAKGNYIDNIKINQIPHYDCKKGIWFKDFELKLGLELIAIIGNKGKGKSAIADIIGLLGNSHIIKKDFSFLNSDRFGQKGYSENFSGTLTWFDKTQSTKSLDENIDFTDVERIKYIPQSYLEKLCNDEASNFKNEINTVVFSRLDDSEKLGKNTFGDLEEYKTEVISRQIDLLSIKLGHINKHLHYLEEKTNPSYKLRIENLKNIKTSSLQLLEKEKAGIVIVLNPNTDTSLSSAQRQRAEKVSSLLGEIAALESRIELEEDNLTTLKIRMSSLLDLESEIMAMRNYFENWKGEQRENFAKFQFKLDDMILLITDNKAVTDELNLVNIGLKLSSDSLYSISTKDQLNKKGLIENLEDLIKEKVDLEKDLEKPFRDYQEYLEQIKDLESKIKSVIGNESTPDTIRFFDKELLYIKTNLPIELGVQKELRRQITIEVYNQKLQIHRFYNKLKESISAVLEEHSAEQNITIESSFKVDKTFYSQFFDYVFRYGDFHINGDEAIRQLIGKYDFNEEENLTSFLDELEKADIRFKDNRKVDFYNYICSLAYLRPEYDLRLNNKGLNQLSPGEKGGLLLVFYLVLDKDNKPLILDQPEDNLDNQSVAEILVPYIKRAKKLRQIIMITHNPNLAIVADAEQIIYMNIDKENNYAVSCDSGGIEDKVMNNHIVDILEGKMKAFENRRLKYKLS